MSLLCSTAEQSGQVRLWDTSTLVDHKKFAAAETTLREVLSPTHAEAQRFLGFALNGQGLTSEANELSKDNPAKKNPE